MHVTAISASDKELSGLGDSIEKSRVLSLGLLEVFNQNLSRSKSSKRSKTIPRLQNETSLSTCFKDLQ